MMKTVNRSALVLHSDKEMFSLIDDVKSYPEFLPWCSGSAILSESEMEDGKQEMVARLDIAKGGIHHSFTTRNQKLFPSCIQLELVDGPFSHLQGIWEFKALNESACKVSFELSFQVSNRLIAMALNPIFEHAANTMMDAFCQRADQIYGTQA